MKKQSNTLMLSVLLAVCALPALAKTPENQSPKTLTFWVDYHLVLAADGSIEELKLQKEGISKVLVENLEKQIRSWQFTPGAVDGLPKRTETTLSLNVQAKPNIGGDYQIGIADAHTGVWLTQNKMVQPRYPSQELRRGVEAVLIFLVTYDADGKVINAVRLGEKLKSMAPFEVASIQAIEQWRFQPEKIGGLGVPGSAHVPITFCTAESSCKKLLTGSKQKEKLAQELAAAVTPISSKVSIVRQAL